MVGSPRKATGRGPADQLALASRTQRGRAASLAAGRRLVRLWHAVRPLAARRGAARRAPAAGAAWLCSRGTSAVPRADRTGTAAARTPDQRRPAGADDPVG